MGGLKMSSIDVGVIVLVALLLGASIYVNFILSKKQKEDENSDKKVG
jgi:uncharacterized membrane protein YukC